MPSCSPSARSTYPAGPDLTVYRGSSSVATAHHSSRHRLPGRSPSTDDIRCAPDGRGPTTNVNIPRARARVYLSDQHVSTSAGQLLLADGSMRAGAILSLSLQVASGLGCDSSREVTHRGPSCCFSPRLRTSTWLPRPLISDYEQVGIFWRVVPDLLRMLF